MGKYRKKPVIIDALLWSGMESDLPEMLKFIADGHKNFDHLPNNDGHVHAGVGYTPPSGELTIPTLEGNHQARPGDYIIRGVKGEFYPCKPEIFRMTYEGVNNMNQGSVEMP